MCVQCFCKPSVTYFSHEVSLTSLTSVLFIPFRLKIFFSTVFLPALFRVNTMSLPMCDVSGTFSAVVVSLAACCSLRIGMARILDKPIAINDIEAKLFMSYRVLYYVVKSQQTKSYKGRQS